MSTRFYETWIPDGNGERSLVKIDLDTIWRETFAEWDARVPTHVAERIATAIEDALLSDADTEPRQMFGDAS